MRAIRFKQKDTDVYLTVVRVADLLKNAKVERWSEASPQGYQRVPDDRRFAPELSRSALRYLKEEEGVFPTSVLINIRSEVEYKPDRNFNGAGDEGELEVPPQEKWWIIDGQHRLEALERAMAEDPIFENYPIPVTMFAFSDPELYNEMRQFYIHNSRVRSVPVDLVWRLLQKMYRRMGRVNLIESEGVPALRSAQALDIADRLRKTENSPWKGKIIVPGIARTPDQFLSERTLVRSIMEIVKETTFSAMDANQLTDLLINYWEAIMDLFPKAVNPQEYTLLRSTGVIAFNVAFPAVYAQCTLKGDFSKDAMESIINRIKERPGRAVKTPFDDDTWHFRTGHGLAIATSMKAIKMLSQEIIERITA
jgi:DGQHR domain-containing protein